MTLAAGLPGQVTGAVAVCALVTLLLWRADRRLPPAATGPFARRLTAGRPATAAQTRALCSALLVAGIGNPRMGGLLAHLLRSALGCLAVAAVLWAMATPRLPAGFATDADALARFAGRLVLSGLVTVLLVDWAAAAVTGPLSPRIARARVAGLVGFALLDLGVRVAALVAVTTATFALYGQAAGSFGGSWRTGVAVVPGTLAAALRFEGLSGIYVWAALLGGFPLALVLLARLSTHRAAPAVWQGLGRVLPLAGRPVRALGVVFGILAGGGALALSLALGVARATGG